MLLWLVFGVAGTADFALPGAGDVWERVALQRANRVNPGRNFLRALSHAELPYFCPASSLESHQGVAEGWGNPFLLCLVRKKQESCMCELLRPDGDECLKENRPKAYRYLWIVGAY